ncbi:MAG: hypothetical protein ACYSW3_22480 [Planctomycetota bacterium]|jgi:hypothetical protein
MKTIDSFEFVYGVCSSVDQESGVHVRYMRDSLMVFNGFPVPEEVQRVPVYVEPVVTPEEVLLHQLFNRPEKEMNCCIGWTDHYGSFRFPDDFGKEGRKYKVIFNKSS